MTIEEYKSQPFKTNGDGEELLIADIWDELGRRNRREIERLVKKGKNPDVLDYFMQDCL